MHQKNTLAARTALRFAASALFVLAFKAGFCEDECPNFIVILADDLGYSDIGCYGGEIDTPNLDSLAADGIRYTQFYNSSRCSPTRASMLTGQYPHRVGLNINGNRLSIDYPTIAELLSDAGYATGLVGKWHLSEAVPFDDDGFLGDGHIQWVNRRSSDQQRYFADPSSYPTARGFDYFYGIIWGVVNFFNPFSLVHGFEPVDHIEKGFYLTDHINQKSVEWIEQRAPEDQPFFLYISHLAPHWPLHAKEETMNKYQGIYDDGWEPLRDRRYSRMISEGLIDPEIYPLPEHCRGWDGFFWGDLPIWEALSPEEISLEVRRMQAHAAMIDDMDRGLGKVFQALKDSGKWENTVILFLSDNGASPEQVRIPGYDRPSMTMDGKKILFRGEVSADDVGAEHAFDGIGPAWANAVNTPFRFWKRESYDGGNRTPLILHWPGGALGSEAAVQDRLGHVADITATLLDLANVEYPEFFDGDRIESMVGKSLFDGHTLDQEGHKMLFFEHDGGAALKTEKWKITRMTPDNSWSLFDMSVDQTETKSIAEEHPLVVKRLEKKWIEWFESFRP